MNSPNDALVALLPNLDERIEHPVEVGWRIYPLPPVFWRRVTVHALAPELAYYGPLPQTQAATRTILGAVHSPAYVYIILGKEGDVLYVGKTVQPVNRLTNHRRNKDWWPQDGALTLLSIHGSDRAEADAVAFKLESLVIRDACPRYNIMGVTH